MENRISEKLKPIKSKEVRERYGLPARKTLYKWHSLGINPQLFVLVEGTLYIDLDEWEKLISKAKEKTMSRIKRMKNLGIAAGSIGNNSSEVNHG